MTSALAPSPIRSLSGSLLALLLGGCSGSGGGGSSGNALEMLHVSVAHNASWAINRPIEFTFSEEVDFLSVSSNTIQIRSDGGAPATGSFSFKPLPGNTGELDRTTVLWQPTCPTLEDLSDAGLRPSTGYRLTVVGTSSRTTNTVRSADGARSVRTTQSRRFVTPGTTNPAYLFVDPVPGPPEPVVRTAGTSGPNALGTYVEIAQDAARIWFELDPQSQTYGLSPAGSEVPLNLYGDAEEQLALMVAFNQPVSPDAVNLSERYLRLEVQDGALDWVPIESRIELLANCSGTGALVRLEPVGLLPAGTRVRVVVRQGFEDIGGDPVRVDLEQFAVAPTEVLDYAGLTPPGDGADEFREEFDFGAGAARSFFDDEALLPTPQALWQDGSLTAAFDFDGTGGPGGNFDWRVPSGEQFTLDTTLAELVGGDGFRPTTVQTVYGGLVDVRNLKVERGAVLKVQGPNPLRINATGYVRIDGEINLNGFSAKNVSTLNTGHLPEAGAAGAAGGGSGGVASWVTNQSTPRGGPGNGPPGLEGLGGQGGESGYAPKNQGGGGREARRPGGGGGGRFAADFDTSDPEGGLWAQSGWDGHPDGRGAETGRSPAAGGLPGKGPFLDGDPDNDFFGVRPVVSPTGELLELIRGELTDLTAGYGGGGGGDAVPARMFPPANWGPGSDEKGGGGGGAAGGMRVRALGPVIFGSVGTIKAIGGRGATGENTGGFDHVGGTGGSGSGGHVILESATRVDFTDGVPLLAPVRKYIRSRGGPRTKGPRNPNQQAKNDVSWGGAGGPGVIQIHVPDPLSGPGLDPASTNLVVPADPNDPTLPTGLDELGAPTPYQMVLTFGARSTARSRWITIGGADLDPGSPVPDVLEFLFAGTDPDGRVTTQLAGQTQHIPELAPLLSDVVVDPDPAGEVTLLTNRTVSLEGGALDPFVSGNADDLYLRTPALLRRFDLRLEQVSQPAVVFRTFEVVDASWDGVGSPLLLTVDVQGGANLFSFRDVEAMGQPIQLDLRPRFFRVRSHVPGALPDTMPLNSLVRIQFEATGVDALGRPDEANILVPLTPDITRFNAPWVTPGALQYFRFQVEFDLAEDPGTPLGAGTRPVSLEFLRIPFRF